MQRVATAPPPLRTLLNDIARHACVELTTLTPLDVDALVARLRPGSYTAVVEGCGGEPLRIDVWVGETCRVCGRYIFDVVTTAIDALHVSYYTHPLYTPVGVLASPTRHQVNTDPTREPFIAVEHWFTLISAPNPATRGATMELLLHRDNGLTRGLDPRALLRIYEHICLAAPPPSPIPPPGTGTWMLHPRSCESPAYVHAYTAKISHVPRDVTMYTVTRAAMGDAATTTTPYIAIAKASNAPTPHDRVTTMVTDSTVVLHTPTTAPPITRLLALPHEQVSGQERES